jgi:hypothetical protein
VAFATEPLKATTTRELVPHPRFMGGRAAVDERLLPTLGAVKFTLFSTVAAWLSATLQNGSTPLRGGIFQTNGHSFRDKLCPAFQHLLSDTLF